MIDKWAVPTSLKLNFHFNLLKMKYDFYTDYVEKEKKDIKKLAHLADEVIVICNNYNLRFIFSLSEIINICA